MLRKVCVGIWNASDSKQGCFLHFGEMFTSIDAINAGAFFELAREESVTDVAVDTNFVTWAKGPVDAGLVGRLLVSTAQHQIGPEPGQRKRIWFEAAAERLGSADAESFDTDEGVQILLTGIQGALDSGAGGIGLTNLRDVRALPGDFSSSLGGKLKPWAPEALFVVPYDSFYSFRKWGRNGEDLLQNATHAAFRHVEQLCGGCQVQVVGDVSDLPSRGKSWLTRFKICAWFEVPGVVSRYAQNIRNTLSSWVKWRSCRAGT